MRDGKPLRRVYYRIAQGYLGKGLDPGIRQLTAHLTDRQLACDAGNTFRSGLVVWPNKRQPAHDSDSRKNVPLETTNNNALPMSLGPGRTGLCIPFSGYHFEAVRRPILFGRLLSLTILARIDSLSQQFTCVMEIFTQFPRYAHYLLPILRIINTKSKNRRSSSCTFFQRLDI